MAILECHEENEKRSEAINFKVSEKEFKDIADTALALGLDKSEYVRVSLFIAKPLLVKMKTNISFYLHLISRLTGDQ